MALDPCENISSRYLPNERTWFYDECNQFICFTHGESKDEDFSIDGLEKYYGTIIEFFDPVEDDCFDEDRQVIFARTEQYLILIAPQYGPDTWLVLTLRRKYDKLFIHETEVRKLGNWCCSIFRGLQQQYTERRYKEYMNYAIQQIEDNIDSIVQLISPSSIMDWRERIGDVKGLPDNIEDVWVVDDAGGILAGWLRGKYTRIGFSYNLKTHTLKRFPTRTKLLSDRTVWGAYTRMRFKHRLDELYTDSEFGLDLR